MGKSIAKITGVALRPGVSRNGRLYEAAAVASAVKRAQARIVAGDRPLSMMTHHDANDSSTHIVGRITALSLDADGAARYEAELADTEHARTIASLIDPSGGQAFLRGVSIRGAWAGPVKRKDVDGQTVEYADDLELDGLDFTKNPGVDGAGVDSMTRTGSRPRETADGRTLIFESVVEANIITETDTDEKGAAALKSGKPAAPPTPGASNYADPGYQNDKAKRYPLDTATHAKAAWSYINMPRNAKNYTEPQLKRIKDRIRKALVKFGVKVTAERWLLTPAEVVTETAVAEMDMWPDRPGSYSVCIDNGMFSINIASYQVDPADLEMCARAAMDGVCAAYLAMDPDEDGDIDGDGPDDESKPDDNAMETVAPQTSPPAAAPAAETATETETGMAESTNAPAAGSPAAPAAAVEQAPVENVAAPVETRLTLGEIQTLFSTFQQAVHGAQPVGAPAESAPAAPIAETAPAAPVVPVVESADEKLARLVREGIAAALPTAVQEHVEAHGVQRKGLVVEAAAPVTPGDADDEYPATWPRENGVPKEAHKMSAEEWKNVRSVLPGAVLAGRTGR